MPSREIRRLKNRAGDKKTSEQLEKRHQSHPLYYLFSVIILVIIVVTFVAYPVVRNVGGPGSIVFGSYNGTDIRYIPGNYFANQRDLLAQQLEGQQPNANQQVLAYQIWRGAFERTVLHTAIMQDAARSGMIVTGNKVDEALTKYGPYVQNGKFSLELYNQTSASDKVATRNLFHENLVEQQYYDDVLYDQKYSTAATDFVKSMASPERQFRYIAYTFGDYPADLVVSYGKDNAKLFRSIHLSRITIKSSEADAKSIHGKLVENPNLFEEIAKNQSKDAFADKGGDMGWRTYNDLKPDFQNTADLDKLFTLKRGDISDVVTASFGWVIYRIDDAAKEPDFTDANTVKNVRDYMNQFERGRIEDYLTNVGNKFRDSAVTAGFDTVAAQNRLSVHQTNYFPINYGGSYFLPQMKSVDNDGALSSGSYKTDFLQEIFSLKVGAISKPIILDTNVVVVQPTDERKAPDTETSAIASYFPYIVQQYSQQDLSDQVTTSKKFVDNFQQVFFSHFNLTSSPK